MDEHIDAEMDAAMLDPVKQAILLLEEKLKAYDVRLEAIEKVLNDLLLGITQLYDKNKREMGISSFRERRGPLYESARGPWDALVKAGLVDGSASLDEGLYEAMEKLKGEGPDWNDDREIEAIKKFTGGLTEKLRELAKVIPVGSAEMEIELTPEQKAMKDVEALKARRGKNSW